MSIQQEPPSGNSGRYSPVLFGVSIGLLVTLFFQFGALLFLAPFSGEAGDFLVRPLFCLAYLLLMIWPVWYLARYQPLAREELLRLRIPPLTTFIAAAVGTLALWQLVQTYLLVQELYLIPSWLGDYYRSQLHDVEESYISLLTWRDPAGFVLSLSAGAILPALGEELLFRGIVQRSVERSLRPGAAIALTAILFATLHFRSTTFVPLAALGAFLGFLTWRSGSIFPAMLGHFLFNSIAIITLYQPYVEQAGSGSASHSSADLLVTLPLAGISMILFILVIRAVARSR